MYAGIDIGASSTDAVLLDETGRLLAYSVVPTCPIHQQASANALRAACNRAGCGPEQIVCTVSTGYGRKNIAEATCQVTEIACHAKGARHYYPDMRTILDIGGQDSKVIKVDKSGKVLDFAMNEKCAAGTGRFLEAMARTLEVRLENMGDLASRSTVEVRLSSICAVFAESEVVSKIAEGKKVEDIVNGIHNSICGRAAAMLDRLGIEPELVMTGGVAKNKGVLAALEDRLKCRVLVPEEPQIVGALGAALYALEKAVG